MTTRTIYGKGGYDTSKPNNNIVGTEEVPDDPRDVNINTLEQRAVNALVNNRAFIANAAPTNAQVVAQVKDLSRQMNALIRLTFNQLDGTD
jgi:hypothetical protein